MTEYGIVHGRFQVFHSDHLEYALAAKAHCERLIVGITSPDPEQTAADAADDHRHLAKENPLSYFERLQLIECALRDAGVAAGEFLIVPFPINRLDLLHHYVPSAATHYLTIYDDWGRTKLDRMQALGFDVEVLWERPLAEKKIHGRKLRRLIAAGEPWRQLVPAGVAALLDSWEIAARLR